MSASATRSVTFGGTEMTFDAALDTLVRQIQGGLNELQTQLRELAQLEENCVEGVDDDFRSA